MSRGLRCLTIKEYLGWVRLAADVWNEVIITGTVRDWEPVRSCLLRPCSSPFILRTDSDHIAHYKLPMMDQVIVSYKTPDAKSIIQQLKWAADAEDEDRFLEHFYTLLDL